MTIQRPVLGLMVTMFALVLLSVGAHCMVLQVIVIIVLRCNVSIWPNYLYTYSIELGQICGRLSQVACYSAYGGFILWVEVYLNNK